MQISPTAQQKTACPCFAFGFSCSPCFVCCCTVSICYVTICYLVIIYEGPSLFSRLSHCFLDIPFQGSRQEHMFVTACHHFCNFVIQQDHAPFPNCPNALRESPGGGCDVGRHSDFLHIVSHDCPVPWHFQENQPRTRDNRPHGLAIFRHQPAHPSPSRD